MWGVHRYMKEIIFSLNVKQELKMIGFDLYWVGQEVHSCFSMRCYGKTKWPFWPTQCFQNMGFPGGASGKESACQYRKRRTLKFNPWVRKIPWRRKWQPTRVFLPGKSIAEEPGGLQSMGLQSQMWLSKKTTIHPGRLWYKWESPYNKKMSGGGSGWVECV